MKAYLLPWLALPLIGAAARPVRLPAAKVRADSQAAIVLDLRLPAGWRLDPAAELRWRFIETWSGFSFPRRKGSRRGGRPPLRIPFRAAPGVTGARLVVDYRRCRDSRCENRSLDYLVVVSASPEADASEVRVPARDPG